MRLNVTKAMKTELQVIYDANGRIDEGLVVKASKKKSSALHKLFHWDDVDAAAAVGRFEIARCIIITVTIIHLPINDLTDRVTVRKYLGTGDGYATVPDAMASKLIRTRILSRALEEIQQFEKRYSHLTEILQATGDLRRRIKKIIKEQEEEL